MKASEFKYFDFPFFEFNKAQNLVMPLIEKGNNLIVSFPPGTGKTVIAEGCFAFHLKTGGGNVAYISPLKALANQKLRDWEKSFEEKPFLISGDSDITMNEAEGRFGIFTAEGFDSAIRKGHPFFRNLSCVCWDEAHLVGDESRGTAYEASMMAVSEQCKARFVLLSGTLTNSKEIARWVKSITGRETSLAISDWRPNQFSIQYHYVKKWSEIDKVVELLKAYRDTKTIVFVHSKIVGKNICQKLKENKIRHVYHNSTLTESKRKTVEEIFSYKYSGVDVIVATSTLAAGVNIG